MKLHKRLSYSERFRHPAISEIEFFFRLFHPRAWFCWKFLVSLSPSGNFVLTENRWVALKVKNKKDLRSRSTLCMCKRFFCVFYVDLCATDFDPPRITNSIIFFFFDKFEPKVCSFGWLHARHWFAAQVEFYLKMWFRRMNASREDRLFCAFCWLLEKKRKKCSNSRPVQCPIVVSYCFAPKPDAVATQFTSLNLVPSGWTLHFCILMLDLFFWLLLDAGIWYLPDWTQTNLSTVHKQLQTNLPLYARTSRFCSPSSRTVLVLHTSTNSYRTYLSSGYLIFFS